MKLQNNFKPETIELFWDQYSCYLCGRSDLGIEFHHTLGRESNSPLNCVPLCPLCHTRHHAQKPLTDNQKAKLLTKTEKHLNQIDYILTDKDKLFYERNKGHYTRSRINKRRV